MCSKKRRHIKQKTAKDSGNAGSMVVSGKGSVLDMFPHLTGLTIDIVIKDIKK